MHAFTQLIFLSNNYMPGTVLSKKKQLSPSWRLHSVGKMDNNKILTNSDSCYKDEKEECDSEAGGWGDFKWVIWEGFLETVTL